MRNNNRKSRSAAPPAATRGNHADFGDLREQAIKVGQDMREFAVTAGDAAVGRLDPLEEYVRESPIRSLLIAAGVGALCGMFLFRR